MREAGDFVAAQGTRVKGVRADNLRAARGRAANDEVRGPAAFQPEHVNCVRFPLSSLSFSHGLGTWVVVTAASLAVMQFTFVLVMRKGLRVHASLPLVMIFICAMIFNVLALLQIGPNTDSSCRIRPIATNISFALAVSSLIEHLAASRLDMRGHSNRKACKNILAAVVIEVLLLIIWAVCDGTPHTAPVRSELQ